jgi:hypothetical protein
VLYVQWSSLYSDDDDDDAVTRDEDSDTTATLQTSAATAALATLNMLLLLALAIIQANENREHQEPRVCSLTVVVASDPFPNSYALRSHWPIDRKNSDFGWAFLDPLLSHLDIRS